MSISTNTKFKKQRNCKYLDCHNECIGKHIFCSLQCYWKDKKQNIYPGQFRKHHSTSITIRQKISNSVSASIKGEGNPRWAGDNIGYGGLHTWVYNTLGEPSQCQKCLKTKNSAKKIRNIHWANISHTYNKRSINDWIALCASCHKLYDLNKLILQI